jgi:hypothetical protein
MEATDWKHLPYAGGLLDQPESLMDDIMVIAGEVAAMKKEKKD